MTNKNLPNFSGRIIFDHIPKTAGTAITTWLRHELGSVVTEALSGEHNQLIHLYGGNNSIISGHTFFDHGGLNPLYEYITLLREPIDRVISWLFFIIGNYEPYQHPELYIEINSFLDSNGEIVGDNIRHHITNAMVKHFCAASELRCDNDEDKIIAALSVLENYSVVGLYEAMPRFLADVADLIGIPRPVEIEKVNVTNQRQTVSEISPILRQRLIELNSLDIELYQRVNAWKEEQWAIEITPPAARTLVSLWSKYNLPSPKQFCSGDILVSDQILNTPDITQGQLLTFEVPFSVTRPISELEIGIHIFDANKKWAFGTNSTLLKQVQRDVETGNYRVFHRIIANLPVGTYTAGFAFAERTETGVTELYWIDAACEFYVNRVESQSSVGYAYFPATISIIKDKS